MSVHKVKIFLSTKKREILLYFPPLSSCMSARIYKSPSLLKSYAGVPMWGAFLSSFQLNFQFIRYIVEIRASFAMDILRQRFILCTACLTKSPIFHRCPMVRLDSLAPTWARTVKHFRLSGFFSFTLSLTGTKRWRFYLRNGSTVCEVKGLESACSHQGYN